MKLKSQCLEQIQPVDPQAADIWVEGRDVHIQLTVPDTGRISSLKASLSAIPGIRTLDLNFSKDTDSWELEWMRRLEGRYLSFEKNSTKLNDSSEAFLDSLATLVKTFAELHLTIRGWTDKKGDLDFNRRLGEGRADRIRKSLILRHCDSTRLETIGLGEQWPDSMMLTDSLARRVDFIFKEGS